MKERGQVEYSSKYFKEPGLSKGCCLEVFKYLRASKKHSFVTPGIDFIVDLMDLDVRAFVFEGSAKKRGRKWSIEYVCCAWSGTQPARLT